MGQITTTKKREKKEKYYKKCAFVVFFYQYRTSLYLSYYSIRSDSFSECMSVMRKIMSYILPCSRKKSVDCCLTDNNSYGMMMNSTVAVKYGATSTVHVDVYMLTA